MTLATAESIADRGHIDPHDIAVRISKLWKSAAVVGPGGACTRAADAFLATGDWRTCGAPVGQAGNGTAMRTAILGLCFLDQPQELPQAAADVSRITHQDPRSIAGGVAIAIASRQLVTCTQDPEPFCRAIAAAAEPYDPVLASHILRLPGMLDDPALALRSIAWAGMSKPEFDSPIITPFVTPTVLASLWCVLRHPNDWSSAVETAIRLGGDVDTLGAIVGALMGGKLGSNSIPSHLANQVLHSERLTTLANRLHAVSVTRA